MCAYIIQHTKICEIPSKMFYDGELKTSYNFSPDCVIENFWPKGPNCPLAFCDIIGQEGGAVSGNKKSSLFSKSNAAEADKVVSLKCIVTVKCNNINSVIHILIAEIHYYDMM